jgi:hypothetical protein
MPKSATIGACERAIEAPDPNLRSQINRLAAANEAAEKLFGQVGGLDELATQAAAQQVEVLRSELSRKLDGSGLLSAPLLSEGLLARPIRIQAACLTESSGCRRSGSAG